MKKKQELGDFSYGVAVGMIIMDIIIIIDFYLKQ